MAIQDIAPGEAIITVPYELALDLGSESSDPTAPAVGARTPITGLTLDLTTILI
jgi:hypothetical protein